MLLKDMGVCLVARYHFDYCGTLKAQIFVQDNLCCCGRTWGCVLLHGITSIIVGLFRHKYLYKIIVELNEVCLVARYDFDYCGTLQAQIFVQDNCGIKWGYVLCTI